MGAVGVGDERADEQASGENRPAHDLSFAAPSDVPLSLGSAEVDEGGGVMAGTLTWLGHAAFRVESPGGKRIYVDPFLDNPKCPEEEKRPERVDLIALTHGHEDHVGSTIELAQRFDCPVIAQVELRGWLSTQGLSEDMTEAPNKGGTVEKLGIKISLTNAHHSSSAFKDGEFKYLGEAAGLVLELEDGTTVYFAGDTCVFGDMQLIARIYEPDVAVLPIGDYYTMGPREAAVALELLGNPRCVPCHWGTFPILTGTPQKLKELAPSADVVEIDPGDSIEL
jgi:L-ascorbate metabolism protein UlaG (beta-lactamase superfamily)